MKRAIPALVAIGVALAAVSPANAAVTKTGAVKMTWNVATSATLALFTQYTEAVALAQGAAAPNLQPSATGVCTGAGTETAFQLTFGALNASTSAAVGCNYKDAIGALVTTNSSSWTVTEWLDVAPTTGITFCVFKDAAADATGKGPASPNTAAPAAYSTACATGGAVLPAGTVASGTVAGNPGTTGLRTDTAPTTPYTWYTGAAATAASGTGIGEDIQINLAANQAASASDANFVIVQLVAN